MTFKKVMLLFIIITGICCLQTYAGPKNEAPANRLHAKAGTDTLYSISLVTIVLGVEVPIPGTVNVLNNALNTLGISPELISLHLGDTVRVESPWATEIKEFILGQPETGVWIDMNPSHPSIKVNLSL